MYAVAMRGEAKCQVNGAATGRERADHLQYRRSARSLPVAAPSEPKNYFFGAGALAAPAAGVAAPAAGVAPAAPAAASPSVASFFAFFFSTTFCTRVLGNPYGLRSVPNWPFSIIFAMRS